MDERTRTEQNGAGITDELREWAVNHRAELNMGQLRPAMIERIADRIDERHEQSKRNLTDALHQQEEATFKLSEKSVLLPVDADGVPIHIGDRVEWSNGSFTVRELKLTEDGWQTWDSEHGYTVHADECIRHVQPDSWERIIGDACDMASRCCDDDAGKAELVERCRRLAGEAQ